MSMIALITGLDERTKEFVSYPNQPFWDARNRLKEILDLVGAPYSIGCPSIQPLCNGVYILSTNQEYEKNGCNVRNITEATMHARKEIYEMIRTLKEKTGRCNM